MAQLEFNGLTGKLRFDRGQREKFTLQILQLQRDHGFEQVIYLFICLSIYCISFHLTVFKFTFCVTSFI